MYTMATNVNQSNLAWQANWYVYKNLFIHINVNIPVHNIYMSIYIRTYISMYEYINIGISVSLYAK